VDGSQQQDARLQLDAVKETVFNQVQSQCWPRYHFADLAHALYRHQIRSQRPGMAAGRDREMICIWPSATNHAAAINATRVNVKAQSNIG
jgi:hypothetical protein